ncbi:hypothetical protein MKX03_016576 [Papaver bracteatum]|nr:hypothetical protein MKX03_016576 [Papaver bracteatum]
MARGKEAGSTPELCAKYFTLADSGQAFYSLLVSDSYRWNGEATPFNLTPSPNADMNGGVGKGNYPAGGVADYRDVVYLGQHSITKFREIMGFTEGTPALWSFPLMCISQTVSMFLATIFISSLANLKLHPRMLTVMYPVSYEETSWKLSSHP